MKKEINTDKLFREKLEGFSESPPAHLWDNIQGQLAAQKRKKRMMYVGWISAAAVVLLAFVAGWYFNENSDNLVSPIAKTELAPIGEDKIENGNDLKELSIENNKIAKSKTEELAVVNLKTETEPNKNKLLASKSSINQPEINLVNPRYRESFELVFLDGIEIRFEPNNFTPELVQGKLIAETEYSNPELLLIAENVRSFNSEKAGENNWKMGMYVSPGYSSHLANHSETYNQQMTSSETSGNANVSGGFSLQYKTGKKWSVESGIYYAQNGQSSKNSVNFFALNQDADYQFAGFESNKSYLSNAINVENGNLQMNSTAGIIAFSETPKGAEISTDFDSRAGASNSLISNGEFSQVFDFVEIPLYVRYRVVDSKLDVELLGGVNAGVVVGNNAFIDNEYGLQNIGKTQDISTLNLSGTVGLGLNYAIGKHFSLAVEPRFNYYLNSINNNPNVDFRPYRVGLFTGVYYEF